MRSAQSRPVASVAELFLVPVRTSVGAVMSPNRASAPPKGPAGERRTSASGAAAASAAWQSAAAACGSAGDQRIFAEAQRRKGPRQETRGVLRRARGEGGAFEREHVEFLRQQLLERGGRRAGLAMERDDGLALPALETTDRGAVRADAALGEVVAHCAAPTCAVRAGGRSCAGSPRWRMRGTTSVAKSRIDFAVSSIVSVLVKPPKMRSITPMPVAS